MKAKYALIGFLFLTMFAFATMAQAATYSLGVTKGQETVWEIKVIDEDKLEDVGIKDISDYSDGDKVGMQSKSKVTDIEEKSDYWVITYDSWDWTDKNFETKADDEDKTTKIYKDPKDVGGSSAVISGAATPVADYLKAIDWDKDFEVSGTTVKSVGYDLGGKSDLFVSATYDSNTGGLSDLKYLNEDDEICYEYGTTGIPGYELPVLLGIVGISTIGLIYLVMRKR